MTVQLLAQNETQRVILSVNFEGCTDDHIQPNFQFILPIGNYCVLTIGAKLSPQSYG